MLLKVIFFNVLGLFGELVFSGIQQLNSKHSQNSERMVGFLKPRSVARRLTDQCEPVGSDMDCRAQSGCRVEFGFANLNRCIHCRPEKYVN